MRSSSLRVCGSQPTAPIAAAFGAAGSNALVLLLLDTQHYGTLIAQVFFGLWLVPIGYLAYKSAGWFPKWLGVVLIVGAVCYLVDLLVAFLAPDLGQKVHTFLVHPVSNCGNRDGPLPACDWGEDRKAGRAHSRRCVNDALNGFVDPVRRLGRLTPGTIQSSCDSRNLRGSEHIVLENIPGLS